jgi:thioredoxin
MASFMFVQCDMNGVKDVEVSTEDFLETIAQDKLTMVDFYTTWCGPCKQMDPHVKKVKEEHQEFNIIQVDAEAQMSIAGRYNIRAYPTVMLFKKGEVVFRSEGALNEEQILSLLNQYK